MLRLALRPLRLASPALLVACTSLAAPDGAGGGGGGGGGGGHSAPAAPVDCTTSTPAGAPTDVCAVAFSCSPGAQHFAMHCALRGSNYACTCSTDRTTNTSTFAVNPFPCTPTAAAATINAACGFGLQLAP